MMWRDASVEAARSLITVSNRLLGSGNLNHAGWSGSNTTQNQAKSRVATDRTSLIKQLQAEEI